MSGNSTNNTDQITFTKVILNKNSINLSIFSAILFRNLVFIWIIRNYIYSFYYLIHFMCVSKIHRPHSPHFRPLTWYAIQKFWILSHFSFFQIGLSEIGTLKMILRPVWFVYFPNTTFSFWGESCKHSKICQRTLYLSTYYSDFDSNLLTTTNKAKYYKALLTKLFGRWYLFFLLCGSSIN